MEFLGWLLSAAPPLGGVSQMKQSFLHLPSRGVYQAGSCNSSLLDCCWYVVTIRPSLLPVTCKYLLVLTQSCLTSPSYLLHTITTLEYLETCCLWKPSVLLTSSNTSFL